MPFTKQQLDQSREENRRWFAATKSMASFLGPLLKWLWRIGPFRRWAERSTGGRVGAISRLAKSGRHEAAADMAMEALKEYPQETSARDTWSSESWWFFAAMAAENLTAAENAEKMETLIAIATNGPTPFEGYSVAETFLVFSHWKYGTKDYDKAFDFALNAARADPTWAEPSFVLGWYCLALGREGAREHLAKAVRAEPKVLSRILEDPVCGRHPHISAYLKRLVDKHP